MERQHGDRVQMLSQHNKRIREIRQNPVNRYTATVCGAFLRAKGLKNSHFYAILKKEKEIDKSGFAEVKMVIIITGASHVGKTILAQRMLEKYKYPYFSIDHLKMGLIRSGITALTPEDDDELTDYLWPIVREIIKTAIENEQNLIVEGCYIPFDWRNSFGEQYLQSIRFICLAMSDEYIDSHFEEIKSHASDIETRLDDSYCTAEQMKQDNHQVIDGYRSNGEQITLITENYDDSIREVFD